MHNTMMHEFCNQKVTDDCASGLESGCSRYRTTNNEGHLCRQWLASLSPDQHDLTIAEYCLANDTNDCKCIDRSTDPTYIHLKSVAAPFPDACWYTPCANASSNNLVPKALTAQQCPTNVNICKQIIDAATTAGNINIHDNKSSINCVFDKDSSLPVGEASPTPPPTIIDLLKSNWKIVTTIIVVMVILLIVILRKH
jgi:hypothetical protein